jgi:hypothetical protein
VLLQVLVSAVVVHFVMVLVILVVLVRRLADRATECALVSAG